MTLLRWTAWSLSAAVLATRGVAAQEPDVPYVPTPPEVVRVMLATAGVGPGDLVYDLGSGDGRIVIAAARDFGARGVGVEIDPALVAEAREIARREGVEADVRFVEQDLFATDLGDATVVTLYLLPSVNARLQPKLLRELRPGSRVVAHAFGMPDWPPDQRLQVEGRNVFFWVVPAQVDGGWEWILPDDPERRRYTIQLTQRFQRVSGTVREPTANGAALEDLHLEGDRLRFTLVERQGQEVVRMRFQGQVLRERIVGSVQVDGGRLRGDWPWTAARTRGR